MTGKPDRSGPADKSDNRPRGATDTRLLAIAAERLRLGGRQAVTVVAVADAAGMTHANVYRYFQSKATLIDAIAAQWLKGLEVTIAAIAEGPDPADAKLETLLSIVAFAQRDLLTDNPNLFAVYADTASGSRPVYRRFRARLHHLIGQILEEGIGSAVFEIGNREQAVIYITDAVARFIHPVVVGLDAQMPRDMVERRLDTLIRTTLRALRSGFV